MTASVAVSWASPLTSGKSAVADCEQDHSYHGEAYVGHSHPLRLESAVEDHQNQNIAKEYCHDVLTQM
ncbi:MAG: hypothetical protein ACRDUS_11240 [Mycobacterium sp.]